MLLKAILLISSDASFFNAIARTDIELKRLGWGNEQERDDLLRTYSKRARQLLTTEELLKFLYYLGS